MIDSWLSIQNHKNFSKFEMLKNRMAEVYGSLQIPNSLNVIPDTTSHKTRIQSKKYIKTHKPKYIHIQRKLKLTATSSSSVLGRGPSGM